LISANLPRYNEVVRLRGRHLVFNVSELCRLMAKALRQGVDDVVAFDKFAEGGSHRVFQANLGDGSEVIARLPYPTPLPKGLGISSEVATTTFLKTKGIPVPEVNDWSATSENSVGSEYMIMEKVQGTDLQDSWYSMNTPERMNVIEKIVDLEEKLFEISLPAFGSICCKGSFLSKTRSIDIPTHSSSKGAGQFCTGPAAEHLWWYSKRAELGVQVGPCQSLSL
jgi:Phosphotransferase enzyme family